MQTMIDADFPMIEFTAESRCDRCAARALCLAKHEDFGELMFCWHHRKEFVDRLEDDGWELVDDYEELEKYQPKTPYSAPV